MKVISVLHHQTRIGNHAYTIPLIRLLLLLSTSWVNRSDIDFDSLGSFKPQAQLSLPFDIDTSIRSPLRGTAFSNVNTLVVHLSQPYSNSEELDVFYLGLFGSYTGAARGIVEATYEAIPQTGDHKLPNTAETGTTQQSL